MKKRVIIARMTRQGQHEDKFDRDFWQKAGHEARFAAAWEMIAETELIRGNNGSQSRLQRSVQNIARRKS